MRLIISSSTLLVSIAIIILINCTIIGNNVRESEINSGLKQSMDYAYDKLVDKYYDEDFLSYYMTTNESGELIYNPDLVAELIGVFCDSLQSRLDSNCDVIVQLLYMDLDIGTFQIRVTEVFEYPFMSKTGTCVFEKTFSLY